MAADLVIGVDIGGTKLVAGIIDARDGDVRVYGRVQRRAPSESQAAVLDALIDAVQEVRAGAAGEIAAVGFGIPSLIDRARGVAVTAVNLPLVDVRFESVMAERLDIPVYVDNDANVAMLAEHRFGAAQGAEHAAMLTIGTGIGGGLLLNGEIYRGSIGSAAELGHMVIDQDGPRCQGNCPNHGCLEAMASGTALAREALALALAFPHSALGQAHAAGREISGPLVTELAHDGDTAAIDALTLIGERLGVGIANLVNIFNPEFVVIGGGVIAAGELLLEPARRVVAERALSPSKDVVQIVRARFGAESGMVGAAALALDGLAHRAPA
jgi:glucokinase